MSSIRQAPLGTRPTAAAAMPPGTPPSRMFGRYYLTRERDIAPRDRLRTIGGALVVAMLAFALAWSDLVNQKVTVVLGFGLGRLAVLAEGSGWPGGWMFSALEFTHFGLLALVFATTLWFGAAHRPATLPGEELIFFRRQSGWIAANAAAGGLACLIGGQLLAGLGLALLSVPVEVWGLSLLCAAGWQLLVPEARIALAVVLDSNMGWGNRIMLSGGVFRFGSRLTVRKDNFIDASARDMGRLEMLGRARGLVIRYRDVDGTQLLLHLRGISHDPEAATLASILNSIFTLALTHEALLDTIRLNRLPPGIRP